MPTPGVRLRILIEWYDPKMTEEYGLAYLENTVNVLKEEYPDAVMQVYCEPNPPADEIEVKKKHPHGRCGDPNCGGDW